MDLTTSFAYQELVEIRRRLDSCSNRAHSFRSRLHPVLLDMSAELRENIFSVVDWTAEMDIHLADQDKFQEVLPILFESIELYMSAILDHAQSMRQKMPSSVCRVQDLDRRQRERYDASLLELRDLSELIREFKARYQELIQADEALLELFGASFHDLNVTRLDQMLERLQYIEKKFPSL